MKHLLTITAAAGIILAFATTSCDKAKEYVDNSIAFNTLSQEKTYILKGSKTAYDVDSDLTYSCEARMLMPTALCGHNVDSLQDAILKVAFDTVATQHSQLIDSAFYNEAKAIGYTPVDTVMPVGNTDGTFIVEGDVASLSSKIMSYSITSSNYMPYAAHGMYETYYINYDLANGRIFTLFDLFTNEGLAVLPDTLAQVAKSMRNYIGPTELTALPAKGNFYIDLRGDLIFVYQPYEIASYAQGIIEIPVPAYQLADFLTDYGRQLLMN